MVDVPSAQGSPETQSEEAPFNVLIYGYEPVSYLWVRSIFGDSRVHEAELTTESLIKPLDFKPKIVVCILGNAAQRASATAPGEEVAPLISLAEVAQILRTRCREASVYLCFDASNGPFLRSEYVDNGFTDAFLLPSETELCKRALREEFARKSGDESELKAVRVMDVLPDERLTFDTFLYLPANNRYVKLSNAGDGMDTNILGKMKSHDMKSLYVPMAQMDAFYDYSAKCLRKMSTGATQSETERTEKVHKAVETLFRGVYETKGVSGFKEGRELTENCKKIALQYIASDPQGGALLKKLGELTGERQTQLSHAHNVAAYSVLFGLGLGLKDVTDLSFAAMFHDLGLCLIPQEIQDKPEHQRTPEEVALYQRHPEQSVLILKEKKVPISEKVQKIIMQHHEYHNGSGYPRGIVGGQVLPEAKILTIADHFDDLTAIIPGRPALSPHHAIEKMRQESYRDAGRVLLDPKYLDSIIKLFSVPS